MMKNITILLKTLLLILTFSCGRYEKITPAWEAEELKPQVFTVGFTQNAIAIPKIRDGLNQINDTGRVLGGIFEALTAELGHQALSEGEQEIQILTQDMPSFERMNFDTFSEISLDYVELRILEKDLSIFNNLNFIKKVKLKISYSKPVKFEEIEIVDKDKKPLKKFEVLSYDENKISIKSSMKKSIEILADYSDLDSNRMIFLDNERHDIRCIINDKLIKKSDKELCDEKNNNVSFIKQSIKFDVSNLDWKTILKNNTRFNLHLFLTADNLPPMAFSEISLKFKVTLKSKFGNKK